MATLNNATNQSTVASSIKTTSATPFTTAVGSGALTSLTVGTGNTAVGFDAGTALTSGSSNTAVGYQSLPAQTSANNCVAVGYFALKNSNGGNNVAIGYEVLEGCTTGSTNTVVGSSSGTGITTSTGQVAVGYDALNGLLTSSASQLYNVAVGYQSLQIANNGKNVAVGGLTLNQITTGQQNVAVGYLAGSAYTSSELQNICIGYDVTGTVGESNTTRIGLSSQTSCYIGGIQNVSQTAPVATVTSSGQLGAAAGIITAPVSSNTATTGFGTSLTAGTAVRNTLGYDINLNISVSVTLATGATLTLGVGSTSTPTVNAVTGSFTTMTALPPINFSAIVPNNYYVLVNTTGTITIGSITVQACPL